MEDTLTDVLAYLVVIAGVVLILLLFRLIACTIANLILLVVWWCLYLLTSGAVDWRDDLVGGSFFGVAGMFFGVPVCACLRYAGDFLIRQRLTKRNLPTDLMTYAKVNREPRPVKPFHDLKPTQPLVIRIGKEEFRIGKESTKEQEKPKENF